MAKDDYFVIVAKILVYLYAKLKGKNKVPAVEYIHPLSKDFPISEDYLNMIIDEMAYHGYIKINRFKAWGGEVVLRDIDSIRITQEGIEYLRDNSTMKKLADTIPMAASIYELFQ